MTTTTHFRRTASQSILRATSIHLVCVHKASAQYYDTCFHYFLNAVQLYHYNISLGLWNASIAHIIASANNQCSWLDTANISKSIWITTGMHMKRYVNITLNFSINEEKLKPPAYELCSSQEEPTNRTIFPLSIS